MSISSTQILACKHHSLPKITKPSFKKIKIKGLFSRLALRKDETSWGLAVLDSEHALRERWRSAKRTQKPTGSDSHRSLIAEPDSGKRPQQRQPPEGKRLMRIKILTLSQSTLPPPPQKNNAFPLKRGHGKARHLQWTRLREAALPKASK